jgi:hypothetical protein
MTEPEYIQGHPQVHDHSDEDVEPDEIPAAGEEGSGDA